eukprot:snap_masked-scaffold_32-processed-gene-2.20-mRNA-1 protein AED:0.17 eAED:0.17 QI:0/-1/0/1/-1/1/1/0/270
MYLHSLFEEEPNFSLALDFAIAYTAIVAFFCTFFSAAYGKFSAEKFTSLDISVDPRLGWFVMELPAPISFVYTVIINPSPEQLSFERLFFYFLFLRHYINRTFYFPLTLRVSPGKKANFSFSVVSIGTSFNTLHGYLNAKYLSSPNLSPQLSNLDIFSKPYFIIGLVLYELGFWGLIYHESVIRNLRKPGEQTYKIPKGGLFNYISNATYFCEILAWFAWSLMILNPAGFFIFSVSCVNLIPRAFKQHNWYKQKFEDYPENRKAFVPFLF